MVKAKRKKSDDDESILEQIVSGEMGLRKAIRVFLNSQPLKRGWYIVIILGLISLSLGLYWLMRSRVDSAVRDRDKYFQALQPWQAMAAGIFPNQPPEKQLVLLRQDLLSISNALTFARASVPVVRIESFAGLPTENLPVTETNRQHLKLHRVEIRNYGEVEIDNFRSRLQIPEPIVSTRVVNCSVGTLVGWRPLKIELLTTGSAGRGPGGIWIGPSSAGYFLYPELAFNPYICVPDGMHYRGQEVVFSGSGEFTGVWELTIDKLPPSGFASVQFYTSDSDRFSNYVCFAQGPKLPERLKASTVIDTNELRFSLEGEYQFQWLQKPQQQYFLMPIVLDTNSRALSCMAVQTNIGSWHPVILESY